jgi:hypothetical protein
MILRLSFFIIAKIILFSGLHGQPYNIDLFLEVKDYNIGPLKPIDLFFEIRNNSFDTAIVNQPSFLTNSIKLKIWRDGRNLIGIENENYFSHSLKMLKPFEKIEFEHDLRVRYPFLVKEGVYIVQAEFYLNDSLFITSNRDSFYIEPLPSSEIEPSTELVKFLGIGANKGIEKFGLEFLTNYPESVFRFPVLRRTAQAIRDLNKFDESIAILENELRSSELSNRERDGLYSDLAWSYYRKGDVKKGIAMLEKIEIETYIKRDLILRWNKELRDGKK